MTSHYGVDSPNAGGHIVRLSVALPRDLHRRVRIYAIEKDTTITALIAQLIRKELEGK
jgi:hypothetical protein